jgi:hypothetical protein
MELWGYGVSGFQGFKPQNLKTPKLQNPKTSKLHSPKLQNFKTPKLPNPKTSAVRTVRQIGVPTDRGSDRAIRQDSQLLEFCIVDVSLVVPVAEMVPRFAQRTKRDSNESGVVLRSISSEPFRKVGWRASRRPPNLIAESEISRDAWSFQNLIHALLKIRCKLPRDKFFGVSDRRHAAWDVQYTGR